MSDKGLNKKPKVYNQIVSVQEHTIMPGEHYEDDVHHSPVKSDEHRDDAEPMLYVDVNLGAGGNQRIVVYEGDTAKALAAKFAEEFCLDTQMKEKLVLLLQQ